MNALVTHDAAGARTRSQTQSGALPASSANRRLRVLHLILTVGPTNAQYNEHCLPARERLDISICSYFRSKLAPDASFRMFEGDDTVRGFLRALRHALRTDYDVVHAHAPQTGAFMALVFAFHPHGRRIWRQSVYTVHDSYEDYKVRNKLLMLAALLTFSRVVFCGHAACESYPRLWRRIVGARGRVVQNAADFQRVEAAIVQAPPPPATPFTVISVARLEAVKDPTTLIRAIASLPDRETRLLIVGTGTLAGRLEDEAARLGVDDRVKLTGLVARDDVFRLIASSHLFVSTSTGEGLPVALMEAMACGCPVLVSDIPPHREVAASADLLPLVGVGDVAGFADAIDRVTRMEPDERRRLGAGCRALVTSRFGLSRMHDEYRAVYEELAAPPEAAT